MIIENILSCKFFWVIKGVLIGVSCIVCFFVWSYDVSEIFEGNEGVVI